MRRTSRILLNALTALSLVLAVFVVLFWVRSLFAYDAYHAVRYDDPTDSYRVSELLVELGNGHVSISSTAGTGSTIPPRHVFVTGTHNENFAERLDSFRLDWILPYGVSNPRTHALVLKFHVWPLLLGLILLPAIWTWRWRHPLPRSARCSTCGYDLRATPDRCPECGAVPVGAGARGRTPSAVRGIGKNGG